MSSSSRFFQFSPSLDGILVCDTIIWATERALLLGWSLEVISPSINALSSAKTVLRTEWTWRKLSKEPMNLLSCCMISHPIGCTNFRRAAKNSSGLLAKSTMSSSTLSPNKTAVFLFTVLLTKFGIILRSLWVNLVVCASSSIPKDVKFLTYSSFKSLTTNVEPGSVASCPNTKLTIL